MKPANEITADKADKTKDSDAIKPDAVLADDKTSMDGSCNLEKPEKGKDAKGVQPSTTARKGDVCGSVTKFESGAINKAKMVVERESSADEGKGRNIIGEKAEGSEENAKESRDDAKESSADARGSKESAKKSDDLVGRRENANGSKERTQEKTMEISGQVCDKRSSPPLKADTTKSKEELENSMISSTLNKASGSILDSNKFNTKVPRDDKDAICDAKHENEEIQKLTDTSSLEGCERNRTEDSANRNAKLLHDSKKTDILITEEKETGFVAEEKRTTFVAEGKSAGFVAEKK